MKIDTRKKTKIVATISDRRCDVPFLTELHRAGMDVVRLNTAHQSPEGSLKVIRNARVTTIYEWTSEVQQIVIDREVMQS